MKLYIPKIIADTPTKLPTLEKTIFYYILNEAFKMQIDNSDNTDFQIDINNLLQTLNNTNIEFVDIKSQSKNAINNLTKIKLSLVDNAFHIKLAPVDNLYILGNSLFITLNPIIIEYLEQIFNGNYETIDLASNNLFFDK